MKLLPAVLFLAAICLAGSQALDCFYRDSSTPAGSNGTMTSCGSSYTNPRCYSVTSGSTNIASCSTSSTPCSTSSYPDCVVCSTNYCNSLNPSSISCYSRSDSSSNGTINACSTGVSTCYSAGTVTGVSAGCGVCSAQKIGYCTTCTSNLCNIVTPSFSCYSFGGVNNGSMISCPAGVTQCFTAIYDISSSTYYSGCGSCNSALYTSCLTCSTSLCNSLTPSTRSCYYRFYNAASPVTNGSPTQCPTGITSCFSNTAYKSFTAFNYAGCGTCSPDTMPSCVMCSSDNCNTALPSSITCTTYQEYYYISVACATGVSKCFNASNLIGDSRDNGCGDCTPSSTSVSGCKSCNTSNCNKAITNWAQPATQYSNNMLTNAPGQTTAKQYSNNMLTNAPGQTTAKYDVTTKADINCYYSFGVNIRTKISSCSSKSCFEYSFASAFTNFFFSGCGNCTFNSGTNCRTCYTDFCNSGTTLGATGMAIAVAAASMRALMKLLD